MPDAPPAPEPFAPQADPAALEDLRVRLTATRWPDAPEDAGWSLGTDLSYLRELADYWADGFDWPAQEAALARLPRFRVRLGGLGIHYVHARAVAPARSRGPVLPLILSHGWPDSFWRYAKVIPLLTDPGAHGAEPADAFDVVVPDMPGYGYSDRPGTSLDAIAVAGLWAELMSVLGYRRFGAAGGDIGSHVSRYLGLDHPGRVAAVHRTDAGLPLFAGDPADLAPEEHAWLEGAAAWGGTEGAYAAMHRTKPQTAAFGLTDSPAGLAAWIVEKLRAWSDCDGDVERSFTRDEILTNVTLYWLTATIGSSMRMYFLAMVTYGGYLFSMALHLQAGLGESPAHAGLVFVPAALGFAVTGLTWRLLPARRHHRIVPTGLTTAALGYLLLAPLLRGGHRGGLPLELDLLLIGLALGLPVSPNLPLALRHVPLPDAADASGLLVTVIQLGQVLGVAALGSTYLIVAHTATAASSAHAIGVTSIALALTASVAAAIAAGLNPRIVRSVRRSVRAARPGPGSASVKRPAAQHAPTPAPDRGPRKTRTDSERRRARDCPPDQAKGLTYDAAPGVVTLPRGDVLRADQMAICLPFACRTHLRQ